MPSDHANLDNLLQQMAGVGKLSSTGAFTLDAGRAGLLLDKFRLPSAAYFMLHAVGAAVASGASEVDILVRRDLFSLTFDGEPFSRDDASDCVASLWSPERTSEVLRLQELAIARGGATAWGAGEFKLLNLPDGRQRLLVPKAGLWNKISGRMVKSEESALMAGHLAGSPYCKLTLNGRLIPGIEPPEMMARGFLVGEGARAAFVGLDRLTSFQDLPVTSGQSLVLDGCVGLICQLPVGHRSPIASLGGYERAKRSFWPGFMDVVLNGRLYRCKLPSGWGGWWGIFWARSLRRDLSFSFLAESDLSGLQSLFETAREHLENPR